MEICGLRAAARARARRPVRDNPSAAGGSATVADSPTLRCSGGQRAKPRQAPAPRRSPRLVLCIACSSSSTTALRFLNSRADSRDATSSANCSGVVSRISGGSVFWRWRREAGVSPVRVSTRTASPISVNGRLEVARDVDRERLERRDVERVQFARPARRQIREIDQARQESRQRLAAAGRRHLQDRLALRRALDQRELMRPRAPAAGGEPGGELRRQQILPPVLTGEVPSVSEAEG